MGVDVKRGSVGAILGAITLLGLAACNDSNGPDDAEPNIGSMVVEFEGTEYSATKALGGFGGTIAQVTSGNAPFTVDFRRPGGGKETVVTATEFEVRLASDNSGSGFPDPIEFERTGAFTGVISGLEEGGEVIIYFSLYHKTELHTEFGPYFLIVRRPVPGGGGGGGGNPN